MNELFFTCFYSSLIPGGMLVTIIGLTLKYWLHKYNLLNRTSHLYEVGADLALEMLSFLEVSVVIYSSTQLLFYYFLHGKA